MELKYDGRDSLTIALSDTDREDEIIPSVSFTPLCSTINREKLREVSEREEIPR